MQLEMNNFDSSPLICDEKLTLQEKKQFVRNLGYVAVLGFLLSIPVLYFSIAERENLSTLFFITAVIASSSALITSCVALFWANRKLQDVILSNDEVQYPEELNNHLATFIYCFSGLQIVINIALILYILVEKNFLTEFLKVKIKPQNNEGN